MDTDHIYKEFQSLFNDLIDEDNYFQKKPLLAHYTSFESLEKILKSEEIWLSNPLFMNDAEEVVFGFTNAIKILRDSQIIRDALVTQQRFDIFRHSYEYYVNQYEDKELLDTYVFCFSEHSLNDAEGLLSIWRGYGADGRGAAIVFDTSKVAPQEGTTLTLAKVYYLSSEERRNWISQKADEFATIIDSLSLPDDKIYLASHALFDRIKMFSLFTKHPGFSEEKEWRIVYLSGRGSDDGMPIEKHYITTAKGVEPKLRLKIRPADGFENNSLDFKELVHSILIGPSAQPTLAEPAFRRMLELIDKPELVSCVRLSTIPYRAT